MLQLRHGVVHTLLPRRDIVLLAGGRGRQLVPGTRRSPQEKARQAPLSSRRSPEAGGRSAHLGSPLHAEQLEGLPGRQALELVPHDLGLRGGKQ